MGFLARDQGFRKVSIYLFVGMVICLLTIGIILDVDAKPKESEMYNEILNESKKIVPLPQAAEIDRRSTEKAELISLTYPTRPI